MKKLLVIALALFVGTIYGQAAKVPTQAKAKFNALYPKAEKIKWDAEENNFEVSFETDDVEMSLLFDAKGNVVEVETALEEDDLPGVVEKSVEKNFKGWEIKEAAKIVRNGKTTFEAELEKGERMIDAIFTPNGKLVKKIVNKEKDEQNNKDEKD